MLRGAWSPAQERRKNEVQADADVLRSCGWTGEPEKRRALNEGGDDQRKARSEFRISYPKGGKKRQLGTSETTVQHWEGVHRSAPVAFVMDYLW